MFRQSMLTHKHQTAQLVILDCATGVDGVFVAGDADTTTLVLEVLHADLNSYKENTSCRLP